MAWFNVTPRRDGTRRTDDETALGLSLRLSPHTSYAVHTRRTKLPLKTEKKTPHALRQSPREGSRSSHNHEELSHLRASYHTHPSVLFSHLPKIRLTLRPGVETQIQTKSLDLL